MMKQTKTILIVEDDTAMRGIVRRKLSDDYKVVEADDGSETVSLVEKHHPDLVLLDLMLPTMDGFDVLERIRKHSDRSIAKTPVIILSNLSSKEDMARVNALGISDYMVKAYHTTEEILDRINQILSPKSQK